LDRVLDQRKPDIEVRSILCAIQLLVLNCCFGPVRTWILPPTDSICVSSRSRPRRKKAMREVANSIRPGSAGNQDHSGHYWEHGYAVVRGLFSPGEMADIQAESRRVYELALQHYATCRHKNVFYEILPESYAGQRYMLQAHWIAWVSPLFERLRRDPRVLAVMEPLLGRDIRQVAQQIHWKPPGTNKRTGYRFHQDLRFRESREAFCDLMTSYINTVMSQRFHIRAS
jgi:hypothetical protein